MSAFVQFVRMGSEARNQTAELQTFHICLRLQVWRCPFSEGQRGGSALLLTRPGRSSGSIPYSDTCVVWRGDHLRSAAKCGAIAEDQRADSRLWNLVPH